MGIFFYNSKINTAWTPLLKVKRALMVGRYKSVQVIKEQFPISTAAAKSCWRCQEDTMDSAVVDFNGRCFPHCHYVSLSRENGITFYSRSELEKYSCWCNCCWRNAKTTKKYEINNIIQSFIRTIQLFYSLLSKCSIF